MKILFSIFALLVGSRAYSQSVAVDISTEADIYVYHYGLKKGGLKCGSGRNGTYRDHTNKYVNEGSKTMNGDGSLVVGSRTGILRQTINMFSVIARTSVVTEGASTKLSLDITESQISKWEDAWTAGCDNNHYFEYLKNAGYKMNATFSYTVPEGVWAVDVEESDYDGTLFAVQKAVGNGQIQGEVFNTREQGQRRIWVTPGTVITKVFKGYDHPALTPNDKNPKHNYWVKFTPVGQQLKVEEMNSQWLQDYVSDLATLLEEGDHDLDIVKALVNKGASILRSRAQFEEALKVLPTNTIRDLSEKLFKVAMGRIEIEGNPELNNSIRIIAAFTSYEVASAMIEELASYCEMTEVELDYTSPNGEKKQVLGLHYAVFLMNRLNNRISEIEIEGKRVNPSLSGYRKFITTLENETIEYNTYGAIFQVDGLKEKLRDSYKVFKRTAQPQRRPFAQALQDLADFYKIFRSAGTGEANTDYVMTEMRNLAEMEDQLLTLVYGQIKNYSPGNDDPINFQNLFTQMDAIEVQAALVARSAQSSMRFLSLADGEGFGNFVDSLLKLRNENIGIIEKAYEVPEFEFDFEKIRQAYNNVERNQKNIATVDRCMKE